ncbi:MAG: glutamine--tRNA ligase/YqeY domain fusion protein [Myxococcales bacterium]|nr:glutamine--tRNA ligase/YqeY domain fusion protein [Myxococcales bacterium]
MSNEAPKGDFIRQIVQEDRASGKRGGRVQTRFPPEPNGFLHIGHAKSICLNFGIARENQARCFLRFDDTNPATEEELFIRSIEEDVQWLGFDWGEDLRFASDYFEQIYQYAEMLIEKGLAYVCELDAEQIREARGVPGRPGTNSPWRDRPAAENLDLFRRMRAGEFPDGSRTLRAKIDMASPNFNLRDPVLYRIKRDPHPKTGTKWCIYPMYDYAHALSDAIEGTTHSICTLEFEDHRPLYDWCVEAIGAKDAPQQIEFARGEVTFMVTSKRKLKELVETKVVASWDDPRMPTIAGLRKRGVPAAALRAFWEQIGVAKNAQTIEIELFEHHVRDELDRTAPRAMVVVDPIKITIEDWPADRVEWATAPRHPNDPSMGTRKIPITREVVIDRADFMMDPPKKFFRLGPGREVRLRYGPIIKCERVVTNDAGEPVEIFCSHDPQSLDPNAEQRKVKGVVHWVSTGHAVPVEARLYDRLFTTAEPANVPEGEDWRKNINTKSLEVASGALGESSLKDARAGDRFQLERVGYFVVDSTGDKLVMNRTVGLRDSYAKAQNKEG